MNPVSGSGRLVLAAAPIGQPRDASPRLADALGTADVVVTDDVAWLRATAAGLNAPPTGRVTDTDEPVGPLVEAIRDGATVLVVTSDGIPGASAPELVAACAAEGASVSCLPGPSAVTAALALSGLPSDRFCFEDTPPDGPEARRRWLADLAREPRTVVFHADPARLGETLAEAAAAWGADRPAAVCRDMTGPGEDVRRGALGELAAWAAGGVTGPVTVVVAGAQPEEAGEGDVEALVAEVERRVAEGARLKQAVAEVAETSASTGKKALYDAVLAARRGS
ncbi:16S rRNA (cytidine1402-2'-O)-methyltransferase [Streptoalloteichus tenebrarius]|uniref:16S rRNA (Cytidine1402-2'-O)-methyltransferase n=1 Tax=Streptoalloteichus tenebrarius (strain ATCC 17920 / DSM 40477 / JCM 4838 / CBS 697.72 / NBRC 16177 / NCIMB 11028 / NRRL B-12390 / A12253. 1 / ISP 5477) TaxID=1933 RepID=A0ABT1I4N6_STRSD|nr:SAM-dependent methyltransferase [Streptoalloteichus tenebrarius]MCP2262535.1 16S rRNA (cytidine1402-2'-O)-methyltransferase [Streptoalloteichus tenebrarius]BFF01241.1 16S rRNA (cytidine(1402)-2'-O)-methyltransferase [Streptoalloteichus tenebrarius]